jgi:hypothetical protein
MTHATPAISLLVLLLTFNTTALAQTPDIPRTPDGKPDFQGLWTNETQTPLERPVALGDKRAFTPEEAAQQVADTAARVEREAAPIDPNRPPPEKGAPIGLEADWKFPDTTVVTVNGEARTSLVIDPPDGRLPPPPEGGPRDWRTQMLARPGVSEFDGPELRTVGERCLLSVLSPAGPPMVPMAYNSNYQIVQTPDYLMIMAEMVNDVRIIRIDAQPLPEGMVRWMGDSVGHWEGDTLVVTTDKIHPQQSFRGSTGGQKTTEWFSMESPQQINYRVTVNDPEGFSQPWTAEVPLRALPAGTQLYEYACHEGNYSIVGALAGARQQERDAREAAAGGHGTPQ